MTDQKRDYSTPYDNLFDTFFGAGRLWDEESKTILARGASEERKPSFAAKWAADNSARFGGEFNRTGVYGAFRFTFDKDKAESHKNGGAYHVPYSLTADTLAKMAAVLEAHAYTVVAPEDL